MLHHVAGGSHHTDFCGRVRSKRGVACLQNHLSIYKSWARMRVYVHPLQSCTVEEAEAWLMFDSRGRHHRHFMNSQVSLWQNSSVLPILYI